MTTTRFFSQAYSSMLLLRIQSVESPKVPWSSHRTLYFSPLPVKFRRGLLPWLVREDDVQVRVVLQALAFKVQVEQGHGEPPFSLGKSVADVTGAHALDGLVQGQPVEDL